MRTLELITSELNAAATSLVERMTQWETQEKDLVSQLRDEHLPEVETLVATVKRTQAEALAYVDTHRAEFARPKSQCLNFWTVGLKKGPGKVLIPDAEMTLKLIKTKLKAKAEELVELKESLRKDALKSLPAPELASIGCELVGTGDQPFCAPTETTTQKTVAAALARTQSAPE